MNKKTELTTYVIVTDEYGIQRYEYFDYPESIKHLNRDIVLNTLAYTEYIATRLSTKSATKHDLDFIEKYRNEKCLHTHSDVHFKLRSTEAPFEYYGFVKVITIDGRQGLYYVGDIKSIDELMMRLEEHENGMEAGEYEIITHPMDMTTLDIVECIDGELENHNRTWMMGSPERLLKHLSHDFSIIQQKKTLIAFGKAIFKEDSYKN